MKLKLPDPFADFAKPIGLRVAEATVITIWVMFGWLAAFLGLAMVVNAFDFRIGLFVHAILTTISVVLAMYISIKAVQRLWGWSK